MQPTIDYLNTHENRFISELIDFLRIPSISAIPKHSPDIRKAAQFLKEKLSVAGADKVHLIETTGNPLVYAEKMVHADLPTILVYGHYDVQPADPYELWTTPPFEPTIKENKIFARGASDDKGQVYIHLKAFETMVALQALPCNIKFILEGEEETGSSSISDFLSAPAHQAMLQADVLLVSDTAMLSIKQPSLATSLRGIVYFEVTVTGPKVDLHSGAYGGAVANPINTLCNMLAALHDNNRQITIPNFYQKVRQLTAEERAELNQIPFNLTDYQQSIGIEAVMGETGYTTLERVGTRPSLDINGIWGGYTGEGAKTVLPAHAHAKLSMRLVPNQMAEEITQSFTKYLTSLAPTGTHINIKVYPGGCNAMEVDQHSPAFQAAQDAFIAVWGEKPLAVREGGSIPIMTQFKEKLGCDIVLMGFGLDADAIHSPNENFNLSCFKKGIATVISFYEKLVKRVHTRTS